VEDIEFSDEFCRFVQMHLPSVEAAELLLQAFDNPEKGLNDPTVRRQADAFRAAGLLDDEFRYRPASDALARHVATLAQAYEQRPVTLVRLIYALRDGKIRSFADAFKLRKS
jgi:hypothetical protein